MTATIAPPAAGETRRRVRIAGKPAGWLTETRRAYVIENMEAYPECNGQRFPTVGAARAWLSRTFAQIASRGHEQRDPRGGVDHEDHRADDSPSLRRG